MMRRKSRLLALALLLAPATASHAQEAEAPPLPPVAAPADAPSSPEAERPLTHVRPALWVVRDEDTTIYLFGTIHILRPDIAWFEGPVRAAFDAAQQVVIEVVAQPGDEQIMARRGMRLDGPALSTLLPPRHWRRYVDILRSHGMSADQLDHVKPWFASLFLSIAPLGGLGYSPESGVDVTIAAAAREAGKTLIGLETTEEQVGFFDTLPADDQLAMLKSTLDEIPKLGITLEKMIAAWGRGDPDRLGPLVNETMGGSSLLEKRLLAERNARWADWIKARLEQPGTVFMAVGAGHLAGNASVQRLLQARGIRAELVDDTPAP